MEQSGMNVAELLHFCNRRAFLHQCLLGLHNFGCINRLELFHEVGADTFKIFTIREPAKVRFKLFQTFPGFRIVLQFCAGHRNRLLVRYLMSRHFPCQLKAIGEKRRDNIRHRDILQFRSFGNCHYFAGGHQHGLFRNFREAKLYHNLYQFRIFLCKFINGTGKINFLCHFFVLLLTF